MRCRCLLMKITNIPVKYTKSESIIKLFNTILEKKQQQQVVKDVSTIMNCSHSFDQSLY